MIKFMTLHDVAKKKKRPNLVAYLNYLRKAVDARPKKWPRGHLDGFQKFVQVVTQVSCSKRVRACTIRFVIIN